MSADVQAQKCGYNQLGSEAAELLIQRIEGDNGSPVVRELQPELRIFE